MFKVSVIGSGPSGISLIGNLLKIKRYPIIWVDNSFNAGKISSYSCVPSNTKIKTFKDYTLQNPSFEIFTKNSFKGYFNLNFLDTPLNPIKHFEEFNPEDTCELIQAKKMLSILTRNIQNYYNNEVELEKSVLISVLRKIINIGF